MKILRINHVGIVSKAHSDCMNFFQNILQLQNLGHEIVEDQKVSVDMLAVEDSRLEFLEPTADDSPISKFIVSKGSGVHHIALEVDDLDAWIVELRSKNVRLLYDAPKIGAHQSKIMFIHPQSTGGILVELVQL